MAIKHCTCIKCGKTKKETDFYKMKDGNRCEMCKECLTRHIDNTDPETFMWILEKFDVPYIEDVWIPMTNNIRMKNPAKFGPMSVMGQYLRVMNMAQYKDYCYADTQAIAEEKARKIEEEKSRREKYKSDLEREQELRRRLEVGQISQAEYDTLSMKNVEQELTSAPKEQPLGSPQFLPSDNAEEARIRKELTEDDFKYLTLKWGSFYKPSEWVKMEDLYNRYKSEYDLNVDREETLKKICKTSLKMDQALDIGDMQDFKSLSAVFDQLRKSGKFTESQNTEAGQREIDSIGQLVSFVEREGGIIPAYDDPIAYPKDKVDFTIKDMQNYLNSLVKNELGLGDLIESFIEKAEKSATDTPEDIMKKGLDPQEEAKKEAPVTEEEARSFQDFYMEEIEKESKGLINSFRDGVQ